MLLQEFIIFTGIVEAIGNVRSVRAGSGVAQIVIAYPTGALDDIKVGDSIAVQGICLTATSITADSFTADVSKETLEHSSIKYLSAGKKVNLERAMMLSSRLGGHIVQGHVDGVGKLKRVTKEANSYLMTFSAPAELMRYIVYKGSIAVSGVSLTVAKTAKDFFSVAVIPHTYEQTTLSTLKAGDMVNIETDVLARYIEKLLKDGQQEIKLIGLISEMQKGALYE